MYQESTRDSEHCELSEMWEHMVTTHEPAEASQLLVDVGLVKMTGPGARNNGMYRNLNLKREARLEVCGCYLPVFKRTHRSNVRS